VLFAVGFLYTASWQVGGVGPARGGDGRVWFYVARRRRRRRCDYDGRRTTTKRLLQDPARRSQQSLVVARPTEQRLLADMCHCASPNEFHTAS